jgi:hypothetical protein
MRRLGLFDAGIVAFRREGHLPPNFVMRRERRNLFNARNAAGALPIFVQE